jgi:hypothetical protein
MGSATKVLRANREVDQLVEDLLDDRRYEPVVVVTTHPGSSAPFVNVDWLAGELDGMARLVVLDTSDATYRLRDSLGDPKLAVFGGFVRVYPEGVAWRSRSADAQLFVCHQGQGHDVGRRIVRHVRDMATGPAFAVGGCQRRGELMKATVDGVLNDGQILVRSSDGVPCVLSASRLYRGVEATRLVQPGQELFGWRRENVMFPEFHPKEIEDDPLVRARRDLPDGSVTLAKVKRTSGDDPRVLIHPQVEALLVHVEDDLTAVISRDEVIAVEVHWNRDRPEVMLAHEEDAGDSLPVLPGGPPWLVPDDHTGGETVDDECVAELTAEDDACRTMESTSFGLDPVEAEATIALLTATQTEMAKKIQVLEKELRRLRKGHRSRKAPEVYSDPEKQFRYEVEQSFLTGRSEAERDECPLPANFFLSDRFLGSLDRLVTGGAISREKIVGVCVEVLCGRARDNSSRALKPWKTSSNGPQERRADGAVAWRVRLQVGASSARRMKYWTTGDGTIELDFVGTHDAGL